MEIPSEASASAPRGDGAARAKRNEFDPVAAITVRSLSDGSGGGGAPPPVNNAYVGSSACQSCHAAQYAQWHQSLHVQMTKPIAEARVEGDFSPGTHLTAYGRSYRMEKSGGRYDISVSINGRPATKYQIDYTLGAKRFQGYLSTLPDGRIYVLPVFWHRTTGRWLDWTEIAPIPRHYTGDLRQIWNVNCVNCHGVNIVPNFDVTTRTYKTTWTEMGVGCEDCHGPGAAHIKLMTTWADHPSERPTLDLSAGNHDLSRTLKIFSPRTAEPRQVLDTCGYCHGNKTNYFIGFTPGSLMEDFAEPFLISEPMPPNDPQGEFWPDGRPSRFNRPQAVMDSECFLKGGATCINCHVAHGSRWDHSLKINIDVAGHPGEHSRQSDRLCTQCHTSFTTPNPAGGAAIAHKFTDAAGLEAHTHHPAGSQGSRCINCHMAGVNWRLLTRRLDHTFKPPVPEMTASFGEPNACTACHDDKTPEWASAAMNRWYHDQARRQAVMKMANAMYRAGAGDTSALEEVAALAVDRTRGPIVRASAATFTGRLVWALRNGASGTTLPPGTRSGQTQTSFGDGSSRPTSDVQRPTSTPSRPKSIPPSSGSVVASAIPGVPRWVINALMGAAADPEPVVRAAATQALGLTGDRRVAMSLVARLADPARVVRANAAQSLLRLGVARLDGPPGLALAKAQDDYVASLKTFKDVAADHASLGWLEAETGHTAEATDELHTAAVLDPKQAWPYIYLGIIAARAGHYPEAIKQWERAKALDKENTGIDRLLAEARKRGGP